MTIIEEMLKNTGSIAVIGAKMDEWETAYKVPYYMSKHGYMIFPVNPKFEGRELFGVEIKDRVDHLIDPIDMVNIFRRPEFLEEHTLEILQMQPLPKYVWFQLGIYNDNAAKMLEEKGIKVVQNRCIMVEHANME
jgi:predicted CoA-binding protein